MKTGPSKVYEKEDPKAEVECDRCGAKIKGKRNVTRHILIAQLLAHFKTICRVGDNNSKPFGT